MVQCFQHEVRVHLRQRLCLISIFYELLCPITFQEVLALQLFRPLPHEILSILHQRIPRHQICLYQRFFLHVAVGTSHDFFYLVSFTARVCHCDNPCTTSSCGRMIYVYPEKTLEHTPGLERGSQEWDGTYKIRVNVEKSINHFKDSFCVANRKTTNEKTSCRFTSCWYITVINCSCCRQNPSTTIHQKSKVFHSLGLTNFIKPEAY